MLNIKHDYKGYVYIPEEDNDEDNVKIKHVIWFGNRIKFHDTSHSPYSVMSRSDFGEFIDSHIERRMKRLMEVKSLLLEQSVELSMTGGSDEMAEKVERCTQILDELYEEGADNGRSNRFQDAKTCWHIRQIKIRIVPLSENMKPTKDPDNTVWWGITLFTQYDDGRRKSNNLALYQARLVAAYEMMSYAVRGALVMAHDLDVPIDSDKIFLLSQIF